MTKLNGLTLALLLPLFSLAQNSGISFQHSSWSQLLAKAKAEKKIIFVDAFTTWCGPCKRMSSDVFTDGEVGSFFNKSFINAKIDMEEGEGLTIASKYDVQSYPTFLFIDGNGKLLHKSIGYQEAPDFIATGRDALDPNKPFYTLKDKYKSGTISESQQYTLARQASELEDPDAASIADLYLGKQKNLLTVENIELILSTVSDPLNKYFTQLNKSEKAAGDIAGATKVRDGLDMIVYRHVAKGLNENDPIATLVAKVEAGIKKYRPATSARRISLQFGQYMAEQAGDENLQKEYNEKYMTEFPDDLDWQKLNEMAWQYFETESDPVQLRKALNWALLSIKKESNFYNNDTAAQLYYKLGDKKNAKSYALIALDMGKKAGENTAETEALLKKLN